VLLHLLRPGDIHRLLGVMLGHHSSGVNQALESLIAEVKEKRQGGREAPNRWRVYRVGGGGLGQGAVIMGGSELSANQAKPATFNATQGANRYKNGDVPAINRLPPAEDAPVLFREEASFPLVGLATPPAPVQSQNEIKPVSQTPPIDDHLGPPQTENRQEAEIWHRPVEINVEEAPPVVQLEKWSNQGGYKQEAILSKTSWGWK